MKTGKKRSMKLKAGVFLFSKNLYYFLKYLFEEGRGREWGTEPHSRAQSHIPWNLDLSQNPKSDI